MTERILQVLKQYAFILVIGLLCLLFLAVGLMIGYSVIGDGKNAFSVLSLDKWQEWLAKFSLK